MPILIVTEHDGSSLRPGSLSAIRFARSVSEESGGDLLALVIGNDVSSVSEESSAYVPTLAASDASLEHPLADRYARVIAAVVSDYQVDRVVAAASTFARDTVGRAAGLCGGVMASDVISHQMEDGECLLQRPMFAGAVLATVVLNGSPQFVTVRPTGYAPAEPAATPCSVQQLSAEDLHGDSDYDGRSQWESLDSRESHRPDVTEAKVVVSGGRAFKNSEDFENLVGGLADCLGGATGSSRALVDAGITANELQVGQTGKIVAPDLYIALGISGAVQHLAGMKNSKTIIAVNKDPDAPIFSVADYGLVGDVYEVVPKLIAGLNAG